MDVLAAIVLLAVLTPPAEDTLTHRYRFPPRDVAREAIRFNRAYRLHVQTRQMMELHRWREWQDVLNETDYLFHCWDWLHAAQEGEGRDQHYWRVSLVRLRELIGDDAYQAGTMPTSVPCWRFEWVR